MFLRIFFVLVWAGAGLGQTAIYRSVQPGITFAINAAAPLKLAGATLFGKGLR